MTFLLVAFVLVGGVYAGKYYGAKLEAKCLAVVLKARAAGVAEYQRVVSDLKQNTGAWVKNVQKYL